MLVGAIPSLTRTGDVRGSNLVSGSILSLLGFDAV